MGTFVQDLRFGLRMLARAPVVTTVATLSLALGIAANAGIFAILSGFMLAPLPYDDQDGLVILREGRRGESIEAFEGVSMANFRDYERTSSSMVSAAAYSVEVANLTGVDVPERLRVVPTTPDLFEVLGVQPALGRGFRPEEGAEGLGNVLVLEHDFWQRRFQGDTDVLGRALTLDGATYAVVGVMPESFDMIPANVDVFRPTDFEALRDNRTSRGFIVFGRLAPGATPDQVQRELDGVFTRIADEYPDTYRGWTLEVMGARDFFPGPTDTKLVMILTAVAFFGLLIACANVANLLLARAEERQKEVAVRTALGAGRHRILRQLLTESVTLGILAGVLGIALSTVEIRWIQGAMPAEIPKAMVPRLDPDVLLATLAVSILAGIAFGIAPALQSARANLRENLGEGSRGGTVGRARKRLRNAFVVGEFAVALALLTGAGFLVEIFNELTEAYPGFTQEGLLTFSMQVSEDRFPDREALVVYQDQLLESLREVPGTEGVAMMSSLPRGRGNPSTPYAVEGRTLAEGSELPTAGLQSVNPEYFQTMGIPLLQGRAFEVTDGPEGQPVVIVSQAFVDREFPDGDPLARSIVVGDESRMIVGVVGTILQQRIALAGDRGEAIYVPVAQVPLRSPSFALRAAGEPTAMAGDVRQAVWRVNPDQPLAQVRTLEDHVAESLAGPRALSLFLGSMGIIALLLAAMGIYGVMAHAVAQQQREIGIRMALGAGRGKVVSMVTRSGLALAGVGMLLGLPLSYLMYRGAVSALNLFEGTLGFSYALWVTAALALVATLSVFLPAHRASRVAPVAALTE